MVAASDFQVWLDTQRSITQTVMVPHIKSAKDAYVTFQMDVIQNSGGSTSRISQAGRVHTLASQDTALSRIAVGAQKGGECRVQLVLSAEGKDVGTYYFDCVKEE